MKSPGGFFLISFQEKTPGDKIQYFILDNNIGGIILFANHCRDIDSLTSWLSDLKKSANPGFIVAVDQEGGRVCRFGPGFPSLESPRYYGHHQEIERYHSDLSRVCEKLARIGINLNLVPSVDLLDTETDHVLDSRTFSDDPQVVSQLTRITIETHHHFGLTTCAKHFPGLGRSHGDPHKVMAQSDLGEADFKATELPPFKDAINNGVDAIMVTHLALKRVVDQPAIVSEKIISGWLKKELPFIGPVITDDLLMSGGLEYKSPEDLTVESFAAGSDLLLFGQNFKQVKKTYRHFVDRYDEGLFTDKRLADATGRLESFRKKLIR